MATTTSSSFAGASSYASRHHHHVVTLRVLAAETGATYRISLPLSDLTYVSKKPAQCEEPSSLTDWDSLARRGPLVGCWSTNAPETPALVA